MKFTNSLKKGKFIKRYKRFFADIKLNNKIITVHCPNTGSMKGLLDKNNNAWIFDNNNPKRKLRYTLEILEVNKKLIGVILKILVNWLLIGLYQKNLRFLA